MNFRCNSAKSFASIGIFGTLLIFIGFHFLDGKMLNLIPKSIGKVNQCQPTKPVESMVFKYNKLLHKMGYTSLSGWSNNDTVKLERFFSAVKHFAISSAERQWFIELLEHFQVICQQSNITFFLYYGGLLGAYRHHGLIPWDDDLDVLMPFSSKSKFEKLLRNHSNLGYGSKGQYVITIFLRDPKKSKSIKGHKWRWPYIEAHFYEVKGETMVHHFESCGASKVSDIFPLIEVPFENMIMPAPRRMDCLVNNCYKNSMTECCSHPYIHSQENFVKNAKQCIDCKLLHSVFPFVSSRRRHGDYVDEQVFLNSRLVKTSRVKKPSCKS